MATPEELLVPVIDVKLIMCTIIHYFDHYSISEREGHV